jgi:hypothetical protein
MTTPQISEYKLESQPNHTRSLVIPRICVTKLNFKFLSRKNVYKKILYETSQWLHFQTQDHEKQ